MNKLAALIIVMALSACSTVTKDLAQTLRYADGKTLGVSNIDFKQLQTRAKGEACTWKLLFALPIYGDGSIITAADRGKVDNVELIGETGVWYFPFNKNCTVVYGESRSWFHSKTRTP